MNFSTLIAAATEFYSVPADISTVHEIDMSAKGVPWKLILPTYAIIGVPILAFLIFLVIKSINRYIVARKNTRKRKESISGLTKEELEQLYGGDYPDKFTSLDNMSREELKLLAKKELEKQGLKPGDKDYFKGPLDWEDVDENFKPRPKIIRSEISKVEIDKTSDDKKSDSPSQSNSDETPPPQKQPE